MRYTDDSERSHLTSRATSRIVLRPLREEDISEAYLSWFRDDEVTRYIEARNITKEDAVNHLRLGKIDDAYRVYAIWHQSDDVHIGNIKLGPIDRKHRIADCVTVIGHRAYWGQGLAAEAIRQVVYIAFAELDLRKLSAGVIDGNIGSVRAYTNAGFITEGRLKGQYILAGQPVDKLVIGCFNPKYFGVGKT